MQGSKNSYYGKGAGKGMTVQDECICIGPYVDSPFNRCIVIGENLSSKYEYHLLIGTPDAILVSRVMTEAEWRPMYTAMRTLFKGLCDRMEMVTQAAQQLNAVIASRYGPGPESKNDEHAADSNKYEPEVTIGPRPEGSV
jgi:hypothetical protein